jgi:2-C-methyl-D-erythritol 4-phosphate cytidylyltransferase
LLSVSTLLVVTLYTIIVAGGTGSRMQSAVPKQYISIGGMPILMHTIKRFYEFSHQMGIILVLPDKDIPMWTKLCKEYAFDIPLTIATGGETRFHSVKNGLSTIKEDDGIVAIHDGVRPFVSVSTISNSFEVAEKEGCAVTVVSLKDSIRKINTDGESHSVDRTIFRLVQTPQTFQIPILRKGYWQAKHANFTDDASVVEAAGFSVSLIDGSYENIKITTPEDLVWAEAFLKR